MLTERPSLSAPQAAKPHSSSKKQFADRVRALAVFTAYHSFATSLPVE
jgi:hypothetical protein